MTAAQSKFHELLRTQIRNEFTASQQYTAVAVYCDDQDLPQLAAHFYAQALEERNHAMGMVQYLLDNDLPMTIPGIDAVRNDFSSLEESWSWCCARSRRSPSRSPRSRAPPATRATTWASSSCSGTSRSRSRRSPR